MTTKLCDCNQGRLPCSCKPVLRVDHGSMSPAERLAFCRGDAAANDAAEAAQLQSWLVGNARHLRPVAHSGLMAWALAALQTQAMAANGASTESRTAESRAVLDTHHKEMAQMQQDRINEQVEMLGAARVQMLTQQVMIGRLVEVLAETYNQNELSPHDNQAIEAVLAEVSKKQDDTTYDHRTDLTAYFGLSYATWLTLPRVLMEAMPKHWKEAMANLLNQYDDAYPNQPELGTTVRVTVGGKLVDTPEWLLNYRHPDHAMINLLRREPAKAESEERA